MGDMGMYSTLMLAAFAAGARTAPIERATDRASPIRMGIRNRRPRFVSCIFSPFWRAAVRSGSPDPGHDPGQRALSRSILIRLGGCADHLGADDLPRRSTQ